jgi:hypothetical protein
MARKRKETRPIISAEGGAPAASATRRRTSHVKAAPHAQVAELKDENPIVEPAAIATGSNAPCTQVSEREEIAKLAYSYWEARGRQGGSPDEDWARAEQEYRRRQAARN